MACVPDSVSDALAPDIWSQVIAQCALYVKISLETEMHTAMRSRRYKAMTSNQSQLSLSFVYFLKPVIGCRQILVSATQSSAPPAIYVEAPHTFDSLATPTFQHIVVLRRYAPICFGAFTSLVTLLLCSRGTWNLTFPKVLTGEVIIRGCNTNVEEAGDTYLGREFKEICPTLPCTLAGNTSQVIKE